LKLADWPSWFDLQSENHGNKKAEKGVYIHDNPKSQAIWGQSGDVTARPPTGSEQWLIAHYQCLGWPLTWIVGAGVAAPDGSKLQVIPECIVTGGAGNVFQAKVGRNWAWFELELQFVHWLGLALWAEQMT